MDIFDKENRILQQQEIEEAIKSERKIFAEWLSKQPSVGDDGWIYKVSWRNIETLKRGEMPDNYSIKRV